mmetsp:Transcript_28897/g.55102  ORF Transcript_28897/g.55102 Transcript_28897/m.55102 type:complete len:228 (-) Transcript_28897:873-1556(-)
MADNYWSSICVASLEYSQPQRNSCCVRMQRKNRTHRLGSQPAFAACYTNGRYWETRKTLQSPLSAQSDHISADNYTSHREQALPFRCSQPASPQPEHRAVAGTPIRGKLDPPILGRFNRLAVVAQRVSAPEQVAAEVAVLPGPRPFDVPARAASFDAAIWPDVDLNQGTRQGLARHNRHEFLLVIDLHQLGLGRGCHRNRNCGACYHAHRETPRNVLQVRSEYGRRP